MLLRLSMTLLLVCSVAGNARAECSCVAVAGEVAASVQAEVMKADGLYARGDYNAALAIYASAYASSRDSVLLYAQGMASWQLGANAKAKELLNAYLAAGGTLTYKDRAQAALGGGVVPAAVGAGAHVVGGLAGGLRGGVEDTGGAVVGTGAEVGGVGAGAVGGLRADVGEKTKIGKKAGIVLGVIAVAAIGAVGIHSIAAGVSTDISLDPKFDLGLGVAGVAVGISAIYVGGLTAATAAAPRCIATLPAGKAIVAPYATQGGGGVAAAMSF